MTRLGLLGLALLAIVLWTWGRRRWPATPLVVIAILGGAAAALLALGLFGEQRTGGYRPAHVENGRIIPGEIE